MNRRVNALVVVWLAVGSAALVAEAGGPIVVRIASDCSVDQETVALDFGNPNYAGPYHREVLWVVDKGPDETAVISSKSAYNQDSLNPMRGWRIKQMLEPQYVLEPGVTEKSSGEPQFEPPYSRDPESGELRGVIWKYDIEIFDAAGRRICYMDPTLCYRTADGAWICSR